MLTNVFVNFLLIILLASQNFAYLSLSKNSINSPPVTLPEGEKIAGAQEVREPVRINYQSQGIKLTARSALVVDEKTGKILFEKNARAKTPIASISKLITALVFLDENPDWKKVVEITKEDEVPGARLKVGRGEKIRVKDLFYASLVGSANNATLALARSTGLSEKDFMIAMNRKAKEVGMENSYFAEPTGLNPVNYSTASDVAQLLKFALKVPEISEASRMREYLFQTVNTKRWIKIKNTDKLLNSFLNNGRYQIFGGKTGYTEEAGYCLAVKVGNEFDNKIIIVVLGSESNYSRFQEVKGLVWWTFNNWQF